MRLVFPFVACAVPCYPLTLLSAPLSSRCVGRSGGRLSAEAFVGDTSPVKTIGDDAGELERFFFDRCDVFVKSGIGGLGAMSSVGVRPAGGTGGDGGKAFGGAAHVCVCRGSRCCCCCPNSRDRSTDLARATNSKRAQVWIECTDRFNTLTHLQSCKFEAERGRDAVIRRSGANGLDATVFVPPNARTRRLDDSSRILVGF